MFTLKRRKGSREETSLDGASKKPMVIPARQSPPAKSSHWFIFIVMLLLLIGVVVPIMVVLRRTTKSNPVTNQTAKVTESSPSNANVTTPTHLGKPEYHVAFPAGGH